MRKPITLLAILLGGTLALPAQTPYPKWEFGVGAGLTNYLGDTNRDFFPSMKENHLGVQGFVRYWMGRSWALRGNALYGRISGRDANFTDRQMRGFSFASQFTEGSLLLEWDAHQRQRYGADGFRSTLSTFFFAGPAVGFFNPRTEYNSAPQQPNPVANDEKIVLDQKADKKAPVIGAVLGMGFKYDYNEKTVLGLELGIRPTLSDLLDGINQSGDPTGNDWYMYVGLNAALRLIPYDPDSDRDGIANSLDKCPDNAGPAQWNGCPDTDSDGLIDKIDDCPGIAGSTAFRGCPDTDGDGISDSKDKCPNVGGTLALEGCPDRDRDGITDRDDACPDLAGTAVFNGCPDTDNDGIPDLRDPCPTQAGPSDRNGCPYVDTDADGIEDRTDKCPTVAGAGPLGCPAEVKAQDMAALAAALRGVQFNSGTAQLTTESTALLDRAVETLKRYPNFQANIDGHTDSDGTDADNLRLSERRANAVRDYLVARGIAGDRLKAHGYGETRPIASNKTPDGKKQNRRIEIELVKVM
jgi:OOP family OmpA-OmpF porin